MRIEVSDTQYWKLLNYYDGLLYCSMFELDGKSDWRMAENLSELHEFGIGDYEEHTNRGFWFREDENRYNAPLSRYEYWVIPVRDII